MNEDLNPADPVGDVVVPDEHEGDAPYEGRSEADTDDVDQGDAPADDVDAETKPDATPGDKTPTAEDEKSRSAKRREKRAEYVADLQERTQRAEAALAAITAKGTTEAEPKEADFTDWADFIAAKAVWASERNHATRQASAMQAERDAMRAESAAMRQAAWAEQVETAKATYSDFERVAYDPSTPINEAMKEVIMSSDQGADLAYFLGTNRSEAARIARMSPLEAARAMGRIEAKISAPTARTATKAPAPIRPVNPRGGTAEASPDRMTPAQYEKWWNAGS
jgi:hypothetical protein